MRKSISKLIMLLVFILCLVFLQTATVSAEDLPAVYQNFISDARWCAGADWSPSQMPKLANFQAWACCAYCADFTKYCYGIDNPRGGIAFYDTNEIAAGDVLTVGNQADGTGHWFACLKRNGNSLYVAEGNISGKVRIGWNYTISSSSYFAEDSRSFTAGYHFGQALYTVSYDANGGTGAPESQTKVEDVALKLSEVTPVREGFLFIGWAKSATATSPNYQPGDTFTENKDMILYAVWAPSKGKCWDNQYWWDLDNGVLTIQATGDPNVSSCDWKAGIVKKVVIKDGVLSIPDHAFNAHTGITEITIPASVTDIGVGAFFRCTGISEIHIPEGVQTIFNETFYGCSNLKTLYFPISLTKVIGFATTESGLTDVYYAGTEDDWKKIEIIADGNDELLKATIHYQGEEEPEKPEATITLSKTKLTIKGVNTKTVTATLSDSDDSISSVNSSNTNVANATFSGDEIQIASSKKKGKATVTVTTAKGATAKLTVTVKAGWALNAKKITLKPKKTFKIKVLAIPSTIKATNFISDKPAIAAVDSKGKVKALKKGKAAITVTLNNGKTLKLKVTVK